MVVFADFNHGPMETPMTETTKAAAQESRSEIFTRNDRVANKSDFPRRRCFSLNCRSKTTEQRVCAWIREATTSVVMYSCRGGMAWI